MSHFFLESAFVKRSHLLQKNHRILGKPCLFGIYVYMGGQVGFAHSGCNRRRNNRGAVPIANVVLYDQHRTKPSLLGSDHGTQIRIVNISAFDTHSHHHSFTFSHAARGSVTIVTMLSGLLNTPAAIWGIFMAPLSAYCFQGYFVKDEKKYT